MGAQTRQQATAGQEVNEWWESLQSVWRRKNVGPAIKLAYAWLWWHVGGRANKLTVYTSVLGAACGSGHEAACRWLRQLDEAGFIEIIDRDTRRGMVELYVNDPNQEIRSRLVRNDPQQELPFAPQEAKPEEAERPPTVSIKDPGGP